MADQGKSDILMRFVIKGPRGVNAECAAQADPNDEWMQEFTTINDASDYSDFFQVLKFDFGFALKDQDSSDKGGKPGTPMHKPGTPDQSKSKSKSTFKSWRSAETDGKPLPYPLEFEPFSFTRLIDAASPIFFQNCCNNVPYETVTLLRRLSIGANKYPTSFLRLTFKQVLITSIDWDDGDVLNETCKMICQDFEVEYKKQANDGSLSGGLMPAHWNWVTNSNPAK